jgi:hypothetical protein
LAQKRALGSCPEAGTIVHIAIKRRSLVCHHEVSRQRGKPSFTQQLHKYVTKHSCIKSCEVEVKGAMDRWNKII